MSEAIFTADLEVVIPPEIKANADHFFSRIAAVAPSILYVFDLEKMENAWANRSLFDHLGYTEEEVQAMGSNILQTLMHPEDFERYPEHFGHLIALDHDGTSKFEYRMQHKSGKWVWLHSHEAPYERSEDGQVTSIIGSAHDITEIKTAAAQVELISSELRHRVNNIFSVVGALVSMTGRRTTEAKEAFDSLSARLTALADAHQIAFQGTDDTDVSARSLLEQTVAPYLKMAPVALAAQDIGISNKAASSIALITHELATNAVKYGGLRTAEGGVEIALEQDGDAALLRWTERFVPPLNEASVAAIADGFGSRMIDLSVQQIGGEFSRAFTPDGMTVTLRFPRETGR